MNKVVYNSCCGGFGLSDEARELYCKLANINNDEKFCDRKIPRHDENLIKVVEILGDKVNSGLSDLDIEVIDGNLYYIEEHDGSEQVITPENCDWIDVRD